MPFDERWLTEVLARGQVRLVGGKTPGEVSAISERAFQAAVVRVAKQHGWLVYHTYDSRRSPSGYPDLTLVHPERQVCVWAEIKVEGGVVTLQQQRWLDGLRQVTRVEAHLWWPEDWARLQATLGG